jgi:hypothetical protein
MFCAVSGAVTVQTYAARNDGLFEFESTSVYVFPAASVTPVGRLLRLLQKTTIVSPTAAVTETRTLPVPVPE